LNVEWAVPNFDTTKGVWATLDLQTSGATLFIYDAAPDIANRQQLESHSFPISDPILPWSEKGVLIQSNPIVATVSPYVSSEQSASLQTPTFVDDLVQVSQDVFQVAFNLTAHLTERLFSTMY
jgi:hypothetical protein